MMRLAQVKRGAKAVGRMKCPFRYGSVQFTTNGEAWRWGIGPLRQEGIHDMKTIRLIAALPMVALCAGCISISTTRPVSHPERVQNNFACEAGSATITTSAVNGVQQVQSLSSSFALSEADRDEAARFVGQFRTLQLSLRGCPPGAIDLRASGVARDHGDAAGTLTLSSRGVTSRLD